MSGKIVAEVWDNGPAAGVTGAALLVLLRMADAADERTRMTWESVATLAAKTGAGQTSVHRVIREMLEAGILINVPDDQCPKESKLYRSAVRQIAPVESWFDTATMAPSQNGTPATMAVSDSDESDVDPATMAPNSSRPVVSTQSEKTSSFHPVERDRSEGRRSSRRTGWPETSSRRQGRETAATRRAREQAEADAHDPEKALWGPTAPADDEPVVGERKPRRKRKVGPAEHLARSFEIAAKEAYTRDRMPEKVPGSSNVAALAGTFAQWMREEQIDRAEIATMIETFWSTAFQRNLDRPAWKDFLHQRADILASQRRKAKVTQVERDRFDPAAWD